MEPKRFGGGALHIGRCILQGLAEGKPAAPTFRDGLATDYVTDAVLKSAASGRWVNVKSA